LGQDDDATGRPRCGDLLSRPLGAVLEGMKGTARAGMDMLSRASCIWRTGQDNWGPDSLRDFTSGGLTVRWHIESERRRKECPRRVVVPTKEVSGPTFVVPFHSVDALWMGFHRGFHRRDGVREVPAAVKYDQGEFRVAPHSVLE